MSKNKHILILDTGSTSRKMLSEYLEKNGFEVTTAENSDMVDRILDRKSWPLLLLDANVRGDEDGLSLCRRVRSTFDLPIIVMTSGAESTDRIIAMEMGADDCLSKPFDLRELLSRVKSVLRRYPAGSKKAEKEIDAYIRFSGWVFDKSRRQLTNPDGQILMLSTTEYRLMETFIEHANEILSRHQLLKITQGRGAAVSDRNIDVQVSRLRNRLRGKRDKAQDLIKTVRGRGYILATPIKFSK